MATIPVYNRPVSIKTGPLGPQASPISFSGTRGLENIGIGLQRAAVGAANLGEAMAAGKARMERDQAITWTGNALAQLGRVFSDFINNDENLKSQTLDDDFKKFSQDEIKKYAANAPNKQASELFGERSFESATAYMDNAFRIASKNRVTANYQAVDQQVNDATVEMHNMYSVDPETARVYAEMRRSQIEQGIDQVFDGLPNAQAERKATLYRNMALAAVETDPDYARALANSPWLDEPTRRSVLAHIEKVKSGLDSRAQVALRASMDSALRGARETGGSVAEIPEAAFQQTFSENAWEGIHEEWTIQRDATNLANETLASVEGLAPATQQAEIAKLADRAAKNPTEPRYSMALAQIRETMARDQSLYRSNRVAYLQEHHPNIRVAWKDATDETLSPEQRATARSNYYDMLEYYQAPAPVDDKGKPINPHLHHPVPYDQITLVAEDEAKTWSEVIRSADTNNYRQKFATFEAEFSVPGDPVKSSERISRAMNDVVRLGKMEGAWELAYMVKDDARAQTYMNALRNAAGEKSNLDKKENPVETILQKIQNHQIRKSFVRAANVDIQRGNRLAEYDEGILSLAIAKINQGESLDDAVNRSVQFLLGSTQFSFETENGKFLSVSRRRPGNAAPRNELDEDEIKAGTDDLFRQFGRYADNPASNPMIGDLMAQLKMKGQDELDLFPIFEETFLGFGTGMSEPKLASVARKIAIDGFPSRGADGNSFTIHVRGDDGFTFQLVDMNGKPISIYFDRRLNGRGVLAPTMESPFTAQSPMAPGSAMEAFLNAYPQFKEIQYDFPDQGLFVDDYINRLRSASDLNK